MPHCAPPLRTPMGEPDALEVRPLFICTLVSSFALCCVAVGMNCRTRLHPTSTGSTTSRVRQTTCMDTPRNPIPTDPIRNDRRTSLTKFGRFRRWASTRTYATTGPCQPPTPGPDPVSRNVPREPSARARLSTATTS